MRTWAVLLVLIDAMAGDPKVTVLSEGKAWLENLVMEPSSDSLFMSELKMGIVWRVRGYANGTYSEMPWLDATSNLTRVLGLTKDVAVPNVFYGVGEYHAQNVVYRASTLVPNNFTIIATLPSSTLGNGFGCHYASGKLYTASEGNFKPKTGSVYEIDPNTGQVTTITTALWAADGLWIDQDLHLLYVGELFTSAVSVWNISGKSAIYIGKLQGFDSTLDDFTLGLNGSIIVGCNWIGDHLMSFNSELTNHTISPSVLVKSGLVHPTSARWGESTHAGAPFPTTAIFVTEGRARDFALKTKNDRLLRIDF